MLCCHTCSGAALAAPPHFSSSIWCKAMMGALLNAQQTCRMLFLMQICRVQ